MLAVLGYIRRRQVPTLTETCRPQEKKDINMKVTVCLLVAFALVAVTSAGYGFGYGGYGLGYGGYGRGYGIGHTYYFDNQRAAPYFYGGYGGYGGYGLLRLIVLCRLKNLDR
ncbi:hypothetical protein V5799_023152 [Amblyomma americanum]|uniref:Uncharacterized protein n=1 Tax=Amblyomma americanum TaxID=6943 RepID=A0AAQ4FIL2_AMBAM